MNWYIAKIVFRIICGDGNHMPQFDEQLRLIKGINGHEAVSKAMRIGQNDEDLFLNEYQKPVRWKFIGISEIYKLDSLTDGLELYSRVREEEDAGTYMDMVHKKSESLYSSLREPLEEAV